MAQPLKARLAANEFTLGSWITIGHPAIAEILAHAGFDWLVIDLEHSTISLDQAGELIRTFDLCGVAPLVRLTSNDPNQIKRLMDAGAHGIVVPMVNAPREAEQAVRATRYPPAGFRGVGLGRAQAYGAGFDAYLAWLKTSAVVVVQIEHRDALRDIEAILAVDGVDAFIIGPYDLSCSLGVSGALDHPDVLTAMAEVRKAAAKLRKPGGVHVVEPDEQRLIDARAAGYNFIPYGVDFRFLDRNARLAVARVAKD